MSFISWSISLGTILELVLVLGGLYTFVTTINKRIDTIQSELSKLREIVTTVAVQDRRILAIEEDIRELRHGHGFVVKPQD